MSYDRGKLRRLDYQYRLVDIGLLTRDSLKEPGLPELYALMPLAERESRKKDPERFLKECVDDIVRSPMGIQEKQKTIVMAQIFAGLAFGKAIIELLRRKFKQIPSGYLEKIKSQDLSTLERITEPVFRSRKPEYS